MSRSAHGLGTDRADDWRDRAACRGKNPRWWDTRAGGLSPDNVVALDMCRNCPVRVKCRDTMREGRPTSVIAGGWAWDSNGIATPYFDDGQQVQQPVTEPDDDRQVTRGGPRRVSGLPAPDFLAAGEDLWVRGHSVEEVAQRYGLAKSTAYSAQQVWRDVPHLVPDVRAGRMSVNRALQEARIVAGSRGTGRGGLFGRRAAERKAS